MKSLEIVNEKIAESECLKVSYSTTIWEDETIINKKELQQIQQSLEVLETILDNCENKFLDILHECLIRGTPIHTEDIKILSAYINKILTIKTMVGGE